MKKSLLLFLALFSISLIIAQNAPVDFEPDGHGAAWTWTVFENDTNPPLEIITNPDESGITTSSTVAKFTALQAGQPFAGCETEHGADVGSFIIDASNSTIRIMVWKSVISDVGIKLVTESGWSKGELKVANTKIDEWEQLSFDFSTVDHEGMTYDQIVVFPDFDVRTSDNVIYFDNITFGDMSTNVTAFEMQNQMELFPNPAHSVLTIISDNSLKNLRVYNIVGELVMVEELFGNTQTLDISQLTDGIYIVKTIQDGIPLVSQFIKN